MKPTDKPSYVLKAPNVQKKIFMKEFIAFALSYQTF